MDQVIKQYKESTGKDARNVFIVVGKESSKQYKFFTDEYVAWLEEKAEAYDRLMNGGKKTLKEWANILGKPIAVDAEGRLLWFPKKPEIGLVTWIWYDNKFGCFGEELPTELIDYSGNWKDSLTLPDGWEEK